MGWLFNEIACEGDVVLVALWGACDIALHGATAYNLK
jgi:hypothetical protein